MRSTARALFPLACAALLATPLPAESRPRDRTARTHHPRPASDNPARVARWMGLEGIPLATSGSQQPIHPARRTACLAWGRLGERYRAVDAWGKVVGQAEVKQPASPDPDLGACFYPGLSVTSGRAGALYVSQGETWKEPASAEWTPSAAERASFDKFAVEAEESAPTTMQNVSARHRHRAPVFFKDAAGGHFGVLGGRALLVARLEAQEGAAAGTWKLVHLGTKATVNSIDDPYKVIAVFDLNGDGNPEIVFDWQSIDDNGQGVLQSEAGGAWRVVARSDYGTTA